MTTPSRIVTPERRSDDVGDTALRPQLLSEFVGQAQARANLSIFIEAARKRNEALDHVLFVGPPGPRQDHAGADRRARARRRLSRHVRPRDRKGRRSRRAAHQSRRARRAVHRRNPSPQPGGGRGALSRDGGFSARPHHRRGTGGALGKNRAGEIHPCRRHHARGPLDQSAARPFWHSGAAEFLHRGRAGKDRHPRRPRAQDRHDAGRRQRDRPPRPRHAAHRRPPVAPRAGLCLRRQTPTPSTARSPTMR